MKTLHIIESEIPGITRTRVRVDQITNIYSGGLEIDIGDFSSMKTRKQKGYYKGNRILRIYRSSWKPDEYFIRHFT